MAEEATPAVNDPVVPQDPTPADPAPAENKDPQPADPLLEELSSDDDTPEVPKAEGEKPKDGDDTPEGKPAEEPEAPKEDEEQPEGTDKPLSPKAENRFQKLANDNREMREYIGKLHELIYKPQTTEELIDEGLSPELAEVRSLKQKLEVDEYTNRVAEAQIGLSNDSGRVIEEFPIFNPNSPEYQADLAADAAVALEKVLIRDPNVPELDASGKRTGKGQIIGAHVSPYQIYKPIADAYEKSNKVGQIRGQQATSKMLSHADPRPSATPKTTKKDPLMDILTSDDD